MLGVGGMQQRVLVIDDSVETANGLRELLKIYGYQVDVLYDGTDAVTRARTFGPEIILCDIRLPMVDGLELARRFRSAPDLAHVTLVAVSGYGSRDKVAEAKLAGFDAHLTKPILVEDLIGTLADLASKR